MNHLKSKGGSGTGDDADKLDGSGNWNARRLKVRQYIYICEVLMCMGLSSIFLVIHEISIAVLGCKGNPCLDGV